MEEVKGGGSRNETADISPFIVTHSQKKLSLQVSVNSSAAVPWAPCVYLCACLSLCLHVRVAASCVTSWLPKPLLMCYYFSFTALVAAVFCIVLLRKQPLPETQDCCCKNKQTEGCCTLLQNVADEVDIFKNIFVSIRSKCITEI